MKKRAMPGAFRSIARFDEWQGRKDSNPRMPESKSGALTNLATPLHSTDNFTGLVGHPIKQNFMTRKRRADARSDSRQLHRSNRWAAWLSPLLPRACYETLQTRLL